MVRKHVLVQRELVVVGQGSAAINVHANVYWIGHTVREEWKGVRVKVTRLSKLRYAII